MQIKNRRDIMLSMIIVLVGGAVIGVGMLCMYLG